MRKIIDWVKHVYGAPARVLQRDFGGELTTRARIEAGIVLTAHELYESDFLTRSAAISYSFVFSLIPLITTSLAFITAFPGLASQRDAIRTWLFQQLLPGAVQTVDVYIGEFAERAGAAGAVSSIVFLVLILLVFQTVEQGANAVWRVERERSWGERLRALALFFVCGSIGAVALVLLQTEISKWTGIGLQILLQVISYVIALGLFTFAIKALPNARVRLGPAFFGGALAGTIWFALKTLFSWYINNVADYSSVYGKLGAVPAFFLWIYLSAALLLGGAHAAFVAQNLRPLALKRQARVSAPPHAFYAVAVCAELARAFRSGEGPLSAKTLAKHLSIAPYFVTESVRALTDAKLLVAVPCTATEQCYMLARAAETITVQDVVQGVTHETLVIPKLTQESSRPWVKPLQLLFQRASASSTSVLSDTAISELERASLITKPSRLEIS